jgi:hypothetical protein
MPNPKTIVRSNSQLDSIKSVNSKLVTFQELWTAYPSGNPYDNSAYSNQCAIRLSVAFHRNGIEMKSFSSKMVKPQSGQPTIGRIILDGKITATRANELGTWLKLQPIAGLGKTENITGSDWESKVKGRTGIVMFDSYWTRDGELAANASGGHIDLWNGARLTNNGVRGTLQTFARFTLGINDPGYRIYSDLRKSKTILFFEVK